VGPMGGDDLIKAGVVRCRSRLDHRRIRVHHYIECGLGGMSSRDKRFELGRRRLLRSAGHPDEDGSGLDLFRSPSVGC
jgi:hypothetical protein